MSKSRYSWWGYVKAIIRRETGLDPQCFYDLVKLLGIAEEKDG